VLACLAESDPLKCAEDSFGPTMTVIGILALLVIFLLALNSKGGDDGGASWGTSDDGGGCDGD